VSEDENSFTKLFLPNFLANALPRLLSNHASQAVSNSDGPDHLGKTEGSTFLHEGASGTARRVARDAPRSLQEQRTMRAVLLYCALTHAEELRGTPHPRWGAQHTEAPHREKHRVAQRSSSSKSADLVPADMVPALNFNSEKAQQSHALVGVKRSYIHCIHKPITRLRLYTVYIRVPDT
jgi:hypothetical protein